MCWLSALPPAGRAHGCIFCILFCRFLCGSLKAKPRSSCWPRKTRSFPQTMDCGRSRALMDKNVTETTISANYGDFLLCAVEKAGSVLGRGVQDPDRRCRKDSCHRTQIAALAPAEDAASSAAAQGTAFPKFEGSDQRATRWTTACLRATPLRWYLRLHCHARPAAQRNTL